MANHDGLGNEGLVFSTQCLERLRVHWPNAEVHEMADAGHYVIEDEAEQVQQFVEEFLTRHRV